MFYVTHMSRGIKQTALITGGAKRIGAHIANHLAQLGFDIALHFSTSEAEAATVKNHVESQGRSCILFQRNFRDSSNVENLIALVIQKCPHVSLLINNASIFEAGTIQATSVDLLHRQFEVNLFAPFILSRDYKNMVQTGHIINILDSQISKNVSSHVAYLLSKKCLSEFTFMAANEFAPNIRVNAIAPGYVLAPKTKSANRFDQYAATVPLNKLSTIDNILISIDYLLNNNDLTGQILYVDGGLHIRHGHPFH